MTAHPAPLFMILYPGDFPGHIRNPRIVTWQFWETFAIGGLFPGCRVIAMPGKDAITLTERRHYTAGEIRALLGLPPGRILE